MSLLMWKQVPLVCVCVCVCVSEWACPSASGECHRTLFWGSKHTRFDPLILSGSSVPGISFDLTLPTLSETNRRLNSPTLNWDAWSVTSWWSCNSIMCRIPNEFCMPKIDPLHHVAANTTTQPNPPSGGTNPGPGCVAGGVAGRLLAPVCISWTVLSSGESLRSGSSSSCGSVSSITGGERCSVCPAWGSSEPGVALAAPAGVSLFSGCILHGNGSWITLLS